MFRPLSEDRGSYIKCSTVGLFLLKQKDSPKCLTVKNLRPVRMTNLRKITSICFMYRAVVNAIRAFARQMTRVRIHATQLLMLKMELS